MYTILDRATGEILFKGNKLEVAQELMIKYSKKGYNCLLFKSNRRV
jgi:hypothetical protein